MNQGIEFRATWLPNGFILVRSMGSGIEHLWDPATGDWRYGGWTVEPYASKAQNVIAQLVNQPVMMSDEINTQRIGRQPSPTLREIYNRAFKRQS